MKHVITAIRILFLAVFVVLVANGKMMLWLALYAVSLLLALLFGRVYCGYCQQVCKFARRMLSIIQSGISVTNS